MKLEPYSLILRQISWDLVQLADSYEDGLIPVDEAMIAVAAPMTLVEYGFFNAKQLYQRHISAMNIFFANEKKLDFYRRCTHQQIKDLLRKEWIPDFEGRDATRRRFFQDLKIVEIVDENDRVHLNPVLADTYRKMTFKGLEYAEPKPQPIASAPSAKTKDTVSSYKSSRAPKPLLTTFMADTDLENALQPLIHSFCIRWQEHYESNSYKWRAYQTFARRFNLDAENLAGNIMDSLRLAEKMMKGPGFQPLSMLMQFAIFAADETRAALADLFDEEQPLNDRIEHYTASFNQLLEKLHEAGMMLEDNNSHQNQRSALILLSFRYPTVYYIFKEDIYPKVRKALNQQLPLLSEFQDRLLGYNAVCEAIRQVLQRNDEIMSFHQRYYPDDVTDLHLLTYEFMVWLGQ